MVCIMTYRKEHPRERRKVYWAGCSSSNHRVAVLDSTGKLIMESILATEAATILQFFRRLARNFVGDVRRRNLATTRLARPDDGVLRRTQS